MKIKRTLMAPLLVATTAMATGGWFLQRGLGQERNIYANARLFEDVLRFVSDNFVDQKQPGELYQMAIDGMLEELGDPHTSLMPAREYERLRLQTQGEYGGIGVQIDRRNGWITVIAPLPGTPGERAGLQAGDQIIEVNGESTRDWDTDMAVSQLRGPKGSAVDIRVARVGVDQPLTIRIVREEIHIQAVPVSYMMPGEVGYVELVSFSESATGELRQAIQRLRSEGARGVILDLRRNPGGLLEQGGAVSDLFLDRGQVIVGDEGPRVEPEPPDGRAHGGPVPGPADRGAGRSGQCVGVGDRGGRAAGSRPRAGRGPDDVRQGVGADAVSADVATTG
jgi:carboxyl-terminal processing protease